MIMKIFLLFPAAVFSAVFNVCAQAAPLGLSEAGNGRTNLVKTGDAIEITLDGNPTTGYAWELASFSTNKLQKMGDVQYRQSEQAGAKLRVGVGGQFIFKFKAIEPGRSEVTLIYRRSWETTAYDKAYSVVIDIQ